MGAGAWKRCNVKVWQCQSGTALSPQACHSPPPRGRGRGERGRLHPFISARFLTLSLVGAGLLWSYWPTLSDMVSRWTHEPQYSHGYLVPLFALILLWMRRGQIAAPSPYPLPHNGGEGRVRGASWWGVVVLVSAGGLRFVAAYAYRNWLDSLSFLLALAGCFVLLGGRRALRWAWPALAFLLFMLPLPYGLEVALAHPLQRLATVVSTYALQTLGFAALSEGNVIIMLNETGEIRIGVVEACSGLSMLMTFFALATAVALLIQRPLVDRIVVVLSAIPIALLTNVARITATGILHEEVGKGVANAVFHDFAGWLMIPFALGLMWLELRLLTRLFVAKEPSRPMPISQTLAASR